MHGQPGRRPDHPYQGRPCGEHGDTQSEKHPLTHQPQDRSAHPVPIRPPQGQLTDSSAVTPHTRTSKVPESKASAPQAPTMVSQLFATLRSTRWKVLLCRGSDSSEAAPRHRLLAALPRRDEMSQRRGVRVPGRCLPRQPHPTTPAHPRTREPGWPGAPTSGLLITPRPLRLPDPRASAPRTKACGACEKDASLRAQNTATAPTTTMIRHAGPSSSASSHSAVDALRMCPAGCGPKGSMTVRDRWNSDDRQEGTGSASAG